MKYAEYLTTCSVFCTRAKSTTSRNLSVMRLDWYVDSSQCNDFYERSEPTLPIIAGGTTYYLQHLFFPGRLVSVDGDGHDPEAFPALFKRIQTLPGELQELWQILDTEEKSNAAPPPDADRFWHLLAALDPESAARWHYRDHRKVLRSLRILRDTGRSQSEWISMQGERDEKPQRNTDRRLIFWVWSEREALRARLDARIGRMVDRGLLHEIQSLREIAAGLPGQGKDFTRGIYQAIGYKEFDTYLEHVNAHGQDEEAQHLFNDAIAAMQVGTRRYAKRQTSWIKNQLIPAVAAAQERGEETYIYLLDATDPRYWEESVHKPALTILDKFLCSGQMPDPVELCGAAASELTALRDQRTSKVVQSRIETNRMYMCPECTNDDSRPFLVRENERKKHMQSRTHRSSIKRRTRYTWISHNKEAGESIRATRARDNRTDSEPYELYDSNE